MRKPQQDLFDFAALAGRRDRAMRLGFSGGADFLHREVAGLLAERLAEVTRDFPKAALIGTGAGAVAAALRPGGAGLTQLDPSPAMAAAQHTTLPMIMAMKEITPTMSLAISRPWSTFLYCSALAMANRLSLWRSMRSATTAGSSPWRTVT